MLRAKSFRICIIILSIGLLFNNPSFNSFTASALSSSTGILEPLYVLPYNNTNNPPTFNWAPVNNTKTNYPHVPFFVIVNVAVGPGPVTCVRDYQNGIANLTKSGTVVLGYVDTSYGNGTVSFKNATAQIDIWKSCYPQIKGIFLDQMSNNPTSDILSYYKNITKYIHVNKTLTYSFGNPGTDTDPKFFGSVDNLNIYESQGTFPSNATLQGKSLWHLTHGKKNFSFLVYGKPNLLSSSFIQGKSVYVGFMFVTNDAAAGSGDTVPWNNIPSQTWLNTLAADLNINSVLLKIQTNNMSDNV